MHNIVESRVSFYYLQSQYETKEPRNLYEPIHYILDLVEKCASAHANEC
jgi:hypothetical protein